MKLVKAMVAYATINNDLQLLETINFTKSELFLNRENILYEKTGIIHDRAASLQTELAVFLIKPEDITALDTLRQQFMDILPDRRQSLVAVKGATDDLKLKFRELDSILADLDHIIPIFETSNPEFIRGHFDSRIIVYLGVRHENSQTMISGTVTDQQTDLPIVNAYVWVVGLGISFNTGTDGTFSIDVKDSGIYTLKVQKEGYQTRTEDPVQIEKGNHVTLDIELQKI